MAASGTKRLLRARKGPDITISGDKIEGLGFDIIRKWQKEFQDDFCPSCIHFDVATGTFKEKGHPNNPEGNAYHYTDITGVCWNSQDRETGKTIGELAALYRSKQEDNSAQG